MKELEKLANLVKKELKLKFDEESVKYIEGFIERQKIEIQKDNWEGLINSCGAFLGQCIIENYGGNWTKNEEGSIVIALDDKNQIFPFAKVSKQFENGLEDSVYSMYSIIPTVFKIEPIKNKKKWWQFGK